jgi:predicted pyridoxine 5'-phosphate oxidase superfamily flavin-nucleotide-binding protein
MANNVFHGGENVFHDGELALQERAGSRERLVETASRLIRPALTAQHQAFFARLPFVIVGGMDGLGRIWATLIADQPGFIQAEGGERVTVRGALDTGDPLSGHLTAGARIGLLGIEAHSGRRNRANGRIVDAGAGGFAMAVDQSFGNCSKYIRSRTAEYLPRQAPAGPVAISPGLSGEARRIIGQADTFFIASAHPGVHQLGARQLGADVSHRGGEAGFVELTDADVLTVPDYAGNEYFNTLGNLSLNPRAGLLFVDFQTSHLLWLTGEVTILHDLPDRVRHPGAERLLRLTVHESRHMTSPAPLRWTPTTGSPTNHQANRPIDQPKG